MSTPLPPLDPPGYLAWIWQKNGNESRPMSVLEYSIHTSSASVVAAWQELTAMAALEHADRSGI